ncbi:carbohydrate-binding module family 18 protein [Piromyces sp. E2]|nr:carbohydrate-binding module family 18 protein [Piromyces sp. E2]|eukprot:OUM59236.1 carbohydrate-binding module family 18 protein [Piromyces sp. E2]
MLKYLTKIGIKDIISDSRGSSNVFINNGKRVVYSSKGKYTGCGPNAGNTKCQEGYCCSAEGFCGKSDDHCDVGCQPKFGLSTIMSEHPNIEFNSTSMLKYLTKTGIKNIISDTHGCGPNAGNHKCQDGYCCSAEGFCGKTDDHCGVGCQPKFGLWKNTLDVVQMLVTPNVKKDIEQYSGCGPNAGNSKCQEGYCCSAEGFCGKTSDHCGVGCQPKFGLCN